MENRSAAGGNVPARAATSAPNGDVPSECGTVATPEEEHARGASAPSTHCESQCAGPATARATRGLSATLNGVPQPKN